MRCLCETLNNVVLFEYLIYLLAFHIFIGLEDYGERTNRQTNGTTDIVKSQKMAHTIL